MLILNVLITEIIAKNEIENKKIENLTIANIVANRVRYYSEDDFKYYKYILNSTVSSASKGYKTRILIADENSIVRCDSSDKLVNKKLEHYEAKQAVKGKNSTGIYDFPEVGHVMYTSVPIYRDNKFVGVVFLSTSINDIFTEVDDMKKTLYLVYVICAVITTVIGIILADYLMYPLKKFTASINKMLKGNLGEKVKINTSDEFKRLANVFNLLSTQLSQVDGQRKDFVANVSHELKTPLCAIKLLSGSLLHENEVNIDIYREFLTDIDSEVDRLTKIIDNLLELVDLDSEKLKLNYRTTYINYLLERIIQRMKPLAEEKNITVNYIESDELQIEIDVDKIQQAVINIIHNAIKYTPDGGVIDIKLYQKDDNMVIQVKDNGIGIPKDSIANIFERFYRVDKARTRGTGGIGLGLSIAHQIVTLHQGSIDIESEVGVGTSFYIIVPTDSRSMYLNGR